MEPDDFRVRSKQIWDSMAKGWEESRGNFWKSTRNVGEWLVNNLSPQPGNTILELAAGPGDTGFAAAAIIGEEGRLISTDFAPAMLKAAERRCAEIGLKNVDFKVMDAEDMDLDDDSLMWSLRGYEYGGPSFFEADPYGDGMIYMNTLNTDEGSGNPGSSA